MLRIGIFQIAGLSAEPLARRMGEAAARRGIDAKVAVYRMGELNEHIDEVDVALVCPQMSYRKRQIREVAEGHGVPFAIIPMGDYSMLNGRAVLAMAVRLVGGSEDSRSRD